MFGINLKHSLATVAVGLLAAAGSASAGTHESGSSPTTGTPGSARPCTSTIRPTSSSSPSRPRDRAPRASARIERRACGGCHGRDLEHDRLRRARRGPRGFSIDIGTSENIAADGLGADYILIADMGGQFYWMRAVEGERIGPVWSSPFTCRSWSSETRGSRSRVLHAQSTPRGSAALPRSPPTTTSCFRRRGWTARRLWPP